MQTSPSLELQLDDFDKPQYYLPFTVETANTAITIAILNHMWNISTNNDRITEIWLGVSRRSRMRNLMNTCESREEQATPALTLITLESVDSATDKKNLSRKVLIF